MSVFYAYSNHNEESLQTYNKVCDKMNDVIIDVSINQFSVNTWNDFDPNRKIFVYGKLVDDFMVVDKVKLSMLGLGAIKELITIVEELKDKIINLEDEINILKSK